MSPAVVSTGGEGRLAGVSRAATVRSPRARRRGCRVQPGLPRHAAPGRGRRHADWRVADPGGGLAETVRGIRDEICLTALFTDPRTAAPAPRG